jgi:hypothetical protein
MASAHERLVEFAGELVELLLALEKAGRLTHAERARLRVALRAWHGLDEVADDA